jgi:hypothetical protein
MLVPLYTPFFHDVCKVDECPERQILPPNLFREHTIPHISLSPFPAYASLVPYCLSLHLRPSTQTPLKLLHLSPTLIPLPRRLGARTPRHAPLIPPPQPQPLLRTQLQFPLQLRTWILPMNEIAETASHTALSTVQSTAGFAKISDRRELAVYGSCGVPARVQCVACFLRAVFVLEARVDIADEIC